MREREKEGKRERGEEKKKSRDGQLTRWLQVLFSMALFWALRRFVICFFISASFFLAAFFLKASSAALAASANIFAFLSAAVGAAAAAAASTAFARSAWKEISGLRAWTLCPFPFTFESLIRSAEVFSLSKEGLPQLSPAV